MVQLADPTIFLEEEAPPLDISMPRVYRRPAAGAFTRGKIPLSSLIARARQAHVKGDAPAFGNAYGELVAEFQPAFQWAFSCWDYLLTTDGCRFLPRTADEKRCHRGDFRVVKENDFRQIIHQSFKDCLIEYLKGPRLPDFGWYVKQTLWLTILKRYRALEQPPDPCQRKLTPYSYLRVSPYRFLNAYHQERVWASIKKLQGLKRKVVELYFLNFYKEEAASQSIEVSATTFRRLRTEALRYLAHLDYLSYVLLIQIERY